MIPAPRETIGRTEALVGDDGVDVDESGVGAFCEPIPSRPRSDVRPTRVGDGAGGDFWAAT